MTAARRLGPEVPMAETGALEWRYRRLLAIYPPAHRRAHGEEMVGVLLAGARPRQRWPKAADTADLIAGAVRIRFRALRGRPAGPAWRDALALVSVIAPILLLADGLASADLLGVAVRSATGSPENPFWLAYPWVWPTTFGPAIVTVFALAGRRRSVAVTALLTTAGAAVPEVVASASYLVSPGLALRVYLGLLAAAGGNGLAGAPARNGDPAVVGGRRDRRHRPRARRADQGPGVRYPGHAGTYPSVADRGVPAAHCGRVPDHPHRPPCARTPGDPGCALRRLPARQHVRRSRLVADGHAGGVGAVADAAGDLRDHRACPRSQCPPWGEPTTGLQSRGSTSAHRLIRRRRRPRHHTGRRPVRYQGETSRAISSRRPAGTAPDILRKQREPDWRYDYARIEAPVARHSAVVRDWWPGGGADTSVPGAVEPPLEKGDTVP